MPQQCPPQCFESAPGMASICQGVCVRLYSTSTCYECPSYSETESPLLQTCFLWDWVSEQDTVPQEPIHPPGHKGCWDDSSCQLARGHRTLQHWLGVQKNISILQRPEIWGLTLEERSSLCATGRKHHKISLLGPQVTERCCCSLFWTSKWQVCQLQSLQPSWAPLTHMSRHKTQQTGANQSLDLEFYCTSLLLPRESSWHISVISLCGTFEASWLISAVYKPSESGSELECWGAIDV